MRFESVWAVYFSACGSTRRVLLAMAEAAGEALATMLENVDSGELATCLKVLAQVKQNIRKQAE